MKKILIINGPNLNLLGKRKPGVYGRRSFDDYLEELKKIFPQYHLTYFQSNHEGDLIDKIHESDGKFDAVLLNAGGYTHTSVALRDAVEAVEIPVAEVHISNIREREWFRRFSFLKDVCVVSVTGLGLKSYEEAIRLLARRGFI